MTTLVKYEAARAALAAARSVDEVLQIRDRVEMLRVYAQQAKDKQLIADAVELQQRAERRLGEVIALQRETVGLATGGEHGGRKKIDGSRANPAIAKPTLAEAGIGKRLADKARRAAAMPDQVFDRHVAEVRHKITNVSHVLHTTVEKQVKRAERELALAGKIAALPDLKAGVILADPEWPWESYSASTGMNRAAENHYPTSSIADIKARDVASIAAKDCALFLWTTAQHAAVAIEVIEAWGFAYRSQVIWDKGDHLGKGYWFRSQHEILLLGTRGSPPAPAPGYQWRSIVRAKVGEHSAKPDVFYELIEAYFPNLPKIELNARKKRKGWTAWGNEAPE